MYILLRFSLYWNNIASHVWSRGVSLVLQVCIQNYYFSIIIIYNKINQYYKTVSKVMLNCYIFDDNTKRSVECDNVPAVHGDCMVSAFT